MLNRAPAAVALLIVSFILLGQCNVALAEEYYARVVGISDGDTITVLRGMNPERVRLLGIDAPEKRQAFGNLAKQFTAKQVMGKQVLIKAEGFDRYGRTLGEVVCADGTSLNQLLLKQGYAWVYRKYTNDPALFLLEANAREKRSGLWGDASPIAPWEFRHGRLDSSLAKVQGKVKKVRRRLGQPVG